MIYPPNNNLFIRVHGGGFVGGDKSMVEGYKTLLAIHGYTVLAPNYTLSPKTHYPDPIYQLDELFAYVDENFEYDKLYLAGDSAGGHLISQYALIQTDKAYAQNFKTSSGIEIHALVLYSPLLQIEALTSGDSKIINSLFNQVARSYINDKFWQKSTKTK